MRNISFALTTKQFRDRSKSVTRRLGWKNLKPGERVCGIVKGMGLKPGEKIERLGVIEVVSVSREELRVMTDADCAREGFPEMKAVEFVSMFCKHMGCDPSEIVTRIEFRYVDAAKGGQPCD
jgi:hypothetical protein